MTLNSYLKYLMNREYELKLDITFEKEKYF